jgi:hypothetical protein
VGQLAPEVRPLLLRAVGVGAVAQPLLEVGHHRSWVHRVSLWATGAAVGTQASCRSPPVVAGSR